MTASVTDLLPNGAEDRKHFDQSPFQFRHNLQQHQAFQLNALLGAAERIAQKWLV